MLVSIRANSRIGSLLNVSTRLLSLSGMCVKIKEYANNVRTHRCIQSDRICWMTLLDYLMEYNLS